MEGLKKQHATLKFESPTSIFMVGPSGSGKTMLTKHLLEQADGMFQTPPSSIFFCYSIWQPLYSEMQQSVSSILFHKGLPTMDQINEWGSEQGHKLLVFDDLMMEAADKDHTEETFTTENDIKPQNKDDVEGQKINKDEHQETKIHNENLNGIETEKSQSYLKMKPSTFLKVKQPKSKMRNAGVKGHKQEQNG
ncbi:unnamed protein product [Mytilus edulis]|uniref:Uncharacterized protein n=1 Tax=Mytilus edulis TaxID=6550 RepID=A0A8S3UV52_MYTED|nr:unnamed protein product [Mytilus edulis]